MCWVATRSCLRTTHGGTSLSSLISAVCLSITQALAQLSYLPGFMTYLESARILFGLLYKFVPDEPIEYPEPMRGLMIY